MSAGLPTMSTALSAQEMTVNSGSGIQGGPMLAHVGDDDQPMAVLLPTAPMCSSFAAITYQPITVCCVKVWISSSHLDQPTGVLASSNGPYAIVNSSMLMSTSVHVPAGCLGKQSHCWSFLGTATGCGTAATALTMISSCSAAAQIPRCLCGTHQHWQSLRGLMGSRCQVARAVATHHSGGQGNVVTGARCLAQSAICISTQTTTAFAVTVLCWLSW